MRGAPQAGFSPTIRKINSRTSFDVGLLPTRVLTLEISLQCKPTLDRVVLLTSQLIPVAEAVICVRGGRISA